MGAVSRTARAQPGAAPAQRSHRPIRPYRGPLLGTSGRSLISLSPARQGTRGSPKHRVAGGMLLLSRYLQEYCLQGSTHRFAPNFETLTLKAAPLDKCQIRVVDQPQIAVGIVCDRYGVVVVGARVPVLRERVPPRHSGLRFRSLAASLLAGDLVETHLLGRAPYTMRFDGCGLWSYVPMRDGWDSITHWGR